MFEASDAEVNYFGTCLWARDWNWFISTSYSERWDFLFEITDDTEPMEMCLAYDW